MSSIEFEFAAYLVVSRQFGSTAMIQHTMGVSINRAKILMAALERNGIVGPEVHGGLFAREVLIPLDRLSEVPPIMRPDLAVRAASR